MVDLGGELGELSGVWGLELERGEGRGAGENAASAA